VKLGVDCRVAIMGRYVVGLEIREPSIRCEHAQNTRMDSVHFLWRREVDVARLYRVQEPARSNKRNGIGCDGGGSRGAGWLRGRRGEGLRHP
jgi:hypothetical protein